MHLFLKKFFLGINSITTNLKEEEEEKNKYKKNNLNKKSFCWIAHKWETRMIK